MRLAVLCACLLSPLLLANADVERPRLTFTGLGEVHIGMSADALRDLGFTDPYRGDTGRDDEEYESCHYLSHKGKWAGMSMMINDGLLVRIETDSYSVDEGWRSWSNARIGMSLSELKAIYGDWLEAGLHPYMGDAGTYQNLYSHDRQYRMTFETAQEEGGTEQRVTSFRAGLAGPVGFIEGCS